MSDAARAQARFLMLRWEQRDPILTYAHEQEIAEVLDAFAAEQTARAELCAPDALEYQTARAERAEAQVERLRAAASRVMAIADRDHEAFVALRVLLADPPSGAPR